MLRSFLGTRRKLHDSTQSLNSLEEQQKLEDAFRAVALVMNDDIEAAEEALGKGNSPFHKLGSGLVVFFRATLGFEQDVMREASELLAEAEASAAEHQRRVQRHPNSSSSSFYPPGTEFALCIAEAQLMGAVVGVLNENLTECIRGFYRLRKAFATLDGILETERKFLRDIESTNSQTQNRSSVTVSKLEGTGDPSTVEVAGTVQHHDLDARKLSDMERDTSVKRFDSDEQIEEFVDAEESKGNDEIPTTYLGHLDIGTNETPDKETVDSRDISLQPVRISSGASGSAEPHHAKGLGEDILQDQPVDVFIHTGANLCFGLLLMIMSLIPPAFNTLLKIVGFRGDREQGLAMLWQASKFKNVHGAIAGLIVLGYYNGITAVADILPSDAFPRERCKTLLSSMREQFPKSQLWMIEEARMLGSERRMEEAVDLTKNSKESALKQTEALRWFDYSMHCMYLHRYEDSSAGFQKCITLNNWSHGFYYYLAGTAHLEMYRMLKGTDPDLAKMHAAKAEELIKKVPKHTGTKRFLARQGPFDAFVERKVRKWEHRAQQWKVDLVDAVGVSPTEEMIYFWGGYRRMRPEHYHDSLARLTWSSSPENGTWSLETIDEKGANALLRAAIYRNLGKLSKAKEILHSEIFAYNKEEFKGNNADTWPCPCAHYEMAVNAWLSRDGSDNDKERLKECSRWLDDVSRWENFDLDTRIGLKVTTARNTLKKYGV
ncbi:outer membrane protein Iml2/Tetratricopeptide repeat protein 39 [Lineolata rhizophorae]|uniref:Inclusion body clearance protein IML2 n=1 Tax=Lineolata rhizophorae TaxID=578093 RepID=A0A6A6PAY9_9PEZI|nr:outer membrane protein Iml2/Tetratricopeptide repeat protein 39 [Lineolata rhizophorae]